MSVLKGLLVRRLLRSLGLGSGCLLMAILASGLMQQSSTAGEPSIRGAEAARAEQLIEQLGAASYQRREAAVANLRELGVIALPHLRDAVRHRDLEIRYRARKLLDAIELVEQQRALSEFLSTGDPALGALLPGWHRFSQIVGHDLSARQLFADMHQTEPDIMRLADRSAVELRSAVEQRNMQFRKTAPRKRTSRMSPATLAVFMFVMLDPACEVSVGTRSMSAAVIGQSQIAAAVSHSEDTAMRRLMSNWIAEADEVSPTHRISVAMQYSFETGVEPALQLIRIRARGSHLQNAIFAVAKLGGPEHLDDLSVLLDDDSVLSEKQQKGKPAFTSQVRDVALAAMLHMSGQNPADYGFERLRPHLKHLFQPNTAGFDSDEKREQALAHWRLWTRVQKAQSLDVDATAVEGVRL